MLLIPWQVRTNVLNAHVDIGIMCVCIYDIYIVGIDPRKYKRGLDGNEDGAASYDGETYRVKNSANDQEEVVFVPIYSSGTDGNNELLTRHKFNFGGQSPMLSKRNAPTEEAEEVRETFGKHDTCDVIHILHNHFPVPG